MSEAKANAAIKAERQAKEQELSTKLQELLESYGYGIQPFLIRSEYGDRPSVRLVEIPKDPTNVQGSVNTETNDGQDTNPGEVGADKEESGAAEPTQS